MSHLTNLKNITFDMTLVVEMKLVQFFKCLHVKYCISGNK